MRRTPRAHLALPLLATAIAVSCGGGVEDTRNTGPTYQAFESAAIENEVPLEVLMAVGYVESRWEMQAPDSHSPGPARWGVMGLAEGGSLDAAASLFDVSTGDLEHDMDANIHAAAGLLAVYAEDILGPSFAEETDPETWLDVVARYSGFDDPDLAFAYAEDVLEVARRGAGLTLESGEVIELEGFAPDTDSVDGAGGDAGQAAGLLGQIQQNLSADSRYAAAFRPASSSNYSRGRSRGVDTIVIHTIQGSYYGAISWFQNPRAEVSAHYVVRSSDGQITQMVKESDTAWHARSWNSRSIGIEHEGYVDRPSYYTEAMYHASARLVCDIAKRHGIPLDRNHVKGHSELSGNDHTDPGRYWDWTRFMRYAREACGQSGGSSGGSGSTKGTAVIQGVIYKAPNTNARISGATVRIAGKTVRSSGNGYYEVSVPAGTHTVTVSASGYRSRAIRRQAASGSQVWGSVGLTKASTSTGTGSLVGVVYQKPSSARRLSGATVKLSNGKTTKTDANGYFSFGVRAGTYTVTATKGGYVEGSVTRKVSAGHEIWGSVGLAKAQARGVVRGVVYAYPNTNQRLAGASVRLSNGATTKADSNGAFRFDVSPGTYRITASASGYKAATKIRTVKAGKTIWGSVGLARAAAVAAAGSLIGVVYESPNVSNRVAGARVWTSTGQSAVANENGVYQLPGVPAGDVSIYATAAGYGMGFTRRTIEAGERRWGSVALPRGDRGSVDGAGVPQVELVSPIDEATVGANPTFVWNDLAPGTMGGKAFSYHVQIVQAWDATATDFLGKTYEFVVEGVEGGQTSQVFPVTLVPGTWVWSVTPLLDGTDPEYGGRMETFHVQ